MIMSHWKNLRPSVQTIALFIALLALIVSFDQMRETRRHNRLSVKPALESTETLSIAYENFVGLTISNKGVGPATLEPFQIYLDGNLVNGEFVNDRYGGWQTVLNRLCDGGSGIKALCVSLDDPVRVSGFRVYVIRGQDVWSPGESHQVFGVAATEHTVEREEAVNAALKRLQVAVCYESTYEERFGHDGGVPPEKIGCQ
jgi:hypothetical protein